MESAIAEAIYAKPMHMHTRTRKSQRLSKEQKTCTLMPACAQKVPTITLAWLEKLNNPKSNDYNLTTGHPKPQKLAEMKF